jgi:hypothetical protein
VEEVYGSSAEGQGLSESQGHDDAVHEGKNKFPVFLNTFLCSCN